MKAGVALHICKAKLSRDMTPVVWQAGADVTAGRACLHFQGSRATHFTRQRNHSSHTIPCPVNWTETFSVRFKKIPLQAWTGTEGSRSFRLPDFKTMGA